MAGNWLTNLFNRTASVDPSGSSAGTYDGFAGGGTYGGFDEGGSYGGFAGTYGGFDEGGSYGGFAGTYGGFSGSYDGFAGGGTYGGFSVGAAPLAQDAPYYVDHTNVAVAQSGSGGSTTGLQSEFGPAPVSGNVFVTSSAPVDDLITKNHAIAVNLENQQSERLAAEIKVTPTVIDPVDIISNSQKQTFKDLGIVDSSTSTVTPQDQYAITRKMAQMDSTENGIVGGTSNLTLTKSDDLIAKNHDIAVEQENILASKLATEKQYADIKQAAKDESLDIVSNANKDNFLNGTASAIPSEINTGRVGENGGNGVVSSATDYHSALHDSFTLPAGTPLDSPIPPIMVDNGVGRGQGTIPRFNRGD